MRLGLPGAARPRRSRPRRPGTGESALVSSRISPSGDTSQLRPANASLSDERRFVEATNQPAMIAARRAMGHRYGDLHRVVAPIRSASRSACASRGPYLREGPRRVPFADQDVVRPLADDPHDDLGDLNFLFHRRSCRAESEAYRARGRERHVQVRPSPRFEPALRCDGRASLVRGGRQHLDRQPSDLLLIL